MDLIRQFLYFCFCFFGVWVCVRVHASPNTQVQEIKQIISLHQKQQRVKITYVLCCNEDLVPSCYRWICCHINPITKCISSFSSCTLPWSSSNILYCFSTYFLSHSLLDNTPKLALHVYLCITWGHCINPACVCFSSTRSSLLLRWTLQNTLHLPVGELMAITL